MKEYFAICIAIFGIWKYFTTRKSELAWKKTEFIFDQARYIDTDDNIQSSILLLSSTDELKKLFSKKISDYSVEERGLMLGFEKLFNLLERLSYAMLTSKTLTQDEVCHFEWYIESVSDNETLANYCNNNGYKDVLVLAEILKRTSTQ